MFPTLDQPVAIVINKINGAMTQKLFALIYVRYFYNCLIFVLHLFFGRLSLTFAWNCRLFRQVTNNKNKLSLFNFHQVDEREITRYGACAAFSQKGRTRDALVAVGKPDPRGTWLLLTIWAESGATAWLLFFVLPMQYFDFS